MCKLRHRMNVRGNGCAIFNMNAKERLVKYVWMGEMSLKQACLANVTVGNYNQPTARLL